MKANAIPLNAQVDGQWFWSQVIGGDYEHCWLWTGRKSANGYGSIPVTKGWNRGRTSLRAHRWAYESMRADIPESLVLDHLCRHKLCVNPWHLEPVSSRENTQRGLTGALNNRPHCDHGHAFAEHGNTFANGQRKCRICGIARCWLYRHTPPEIQAARKAMGLTAVDLTAYFAGRPQLEIAA